MSYDAKLFPELARSPQARTYTVKSLVFDELARGKIRIPNFQRPLRWRAEQNVELFDSLFRGYPIGSLLLWKRAAPADKLAISGTFLNVDAVNDAKFVVDGQQRVNALAGAMLDLPGTGASFRVEFDWETRQFFSPTLERGRVRDCSVPVSVLADVKRLNRWVREHHLGDEATEILDVVHERLIEYALPAYELETEDEAPLRAVFTRLNATGTRMRAEEVFHALFGTRRDEGIDLNRLVTAVSAEDFGTISRADALKVLLAASGVDPSRRPENLPTNALSSLADTEGTALALTAATSFLRNYAKIPHYRLLPYPVVLPLLTRFFFVHPEPHHAELLRLARWVWRGAATGVHQRAEVGRMREALKDIRADETATATVDRLLHRLPEAPDHPLAWELSKFDARNAASRIEMLALWDLGPKRLPGTWIGEDNSSSSPDDAAEFEAEMAPWRDVMGTEAFDEIFGNIHGEKYTIDDILSQTHMTVQVYRLSEVDDTARDLARTAANRLLLPLESGGVRGVLPFALATPHLVESHLLTPDLIRTLQEPSDFLSIRGELLQQLVADFLTRRTAWDEPDIAAPSAYLDDVDDD